MIKVTARELLTAMQHIDRGAGREPVSSFTQLREAVTPGPVRLQIRQILDAAQAAYEQFTAERQALLAEYAADMPTREGEEATFATPADRAAFFAAVDELLDYRFTIPVAPIPAAQLMQAGISYNDEVRLAFMINNNGREPAPEFEAFAGWREQNDAKSTQEEDAE